MNNLHTIIYDFIRELLVHRNIVSKINIDFFVEGRIFVRAPCEPKDEEEV